jgi:hypothetical protein
MTLSADADYPPCPRCESNVLVDKAGRRPRDWWCHGCEGVFYNGADDVIVPPKARGGRR